MEISRQNQVFYEFGSFRIDAANRLLLQNNKPVPLQPKTFDLLFLLVENNGRVLEKGELIKQLWQDTVVEEANLTQNIYILRRILSRDAAGGTYIETVPKRGYRFSADVKKVSDDSKDKNETPTDTISQQQSSDVDREAGAFAINPLNSRNAEINRVNSGRRNKIILFVLAACLIPTVGGVVLLYKRVLKKESKAEPTKPFEKMKISRLTDTGNIFDPTISPDGKLLAYIDYNDKNVSLWIKNIADGNSNQLVSVTDAFLDNIAFSHDSNYIYYNSSNKWPAIVYQLPVSGGSPRKIAAAVWSAVTPSPDNKQIAFIRLEPNRQESALVIANVDGAGEQKIVTRKAPDVFLTKSSGPAWSPDGQKVALLTANTDWMTVFEVNLSDKTERRITTQNWVSIATIAWLPDGSGLMLAAKEESGFSHQVWHLSYKSGEARRITNDLNNYRHLSLTSDSKTIVAEQRENNSNIWIVPVDDVSRAKQITFGNSKRDGQTGLTCMPDGKIIYASSNNDRIDLWRVDADGANQQQLTNEGRRNEEPTVSPDGRHIAFISDRAGYDNIWVMDVDERKAKQLTFGKGENYPVYTPDGQWIIYTDVVSDTLAIWKIPVGGGSPIQIVTNAEKPTVSPDGLWMTYSFRDEQHNRVIKTAVVPLSGGELLKTFTSHVREFYRWTPDSKGLTYISEKDNNIWIQPLDGSAPKKLTNFNSGEIRWAEWSRDGKSLALSRGGTTYDAVLITDIEK